MENSLTTSVTRLRVHESAVVGRIFLQQENQRRAIWDFCNNICQQRTHAVQQTAQKERPPRGGLSEIQSYVLIKRLLFSSALPAVSVRLFARDRYGHDAVIRAAHLIAH